MKDALQIEDALQDCLEAMLHGGKTLDEALSRYPQLRQELSPLLESALWLRSQRQTLSLSSQRQAALRERVLKAARAHPLPRVQPKPRPLQLRRGNYPNRTAWMWSAVVLVLICLLVFSISGVALAAQNSLPGDNLYAIKAAVEEARIVITWDAAQRARLRLEYAERRLEEVARLSQQGRYEDTPLALSNYKVQLHLALQEAQRTARIQPLQARQLMVEIESRLQTQSETLVTLESLLPPAQVQVVQQAQNASSQALQTAASLLLESEITPTPTATLPEDVSVTPIEGSLPPGLLRQTQSPTPRASFTLHATNTHRPTQRPTLTPRPTNTHRPTQIVQPTKTPKPTQVKPPPPTPKPTNPNKPTVQPQPPGQSKPTKTPKK